MALDYADLRDNTVPDLLTEFGRAVKFRSISRNIYNTDTSDVTSEYEDITTLGVLLDSTLNKQGQRQRDDDTAVQSSGKYVVMSAADLPSTIKPKPLDLLFFGDEDTPWQIIEVVTDFAPAGVSVFYEFKVGY